MPTLDISGTPVVFPFKPYACQLTYIRGVISALNGSKNALLESPTGTGKTLCLLTASLAWQQRNAAKIASQPPPPQATELAYEETAVTDLSRPRQPQKQAVPGPTPSTPSVIIYASRTHSQLGQVANELKNTIYRPRVSLLGSRQQLCVHEEVSQMKGPAKNHACQALVGARRCKYHRGTEGMERAGGGGIGGTGDVGKGVSGTTDQQNTVSDIEELVTLARQHEFCPYYLGRSQAPRAELVLMPYNYLLDPGTRRGIKLNWSNAVVIFDEAHNLESVASEASSFELTSAQIAGAQEEALRCHNLCTENGLDEDAGSGVQEADNALLVKQALHLLEDAMEGIKLPSGSSQPGVTRAGEFVYALFEHAGITFDTAAAWIGKLQGMTDTLQENALFGQANALKLDSVARAIKVAFRGGNASREECLNFAQMYRAHIAPAESVMPFDGGGRKGRGGGAGAGRVLCFWCFCPGVAMEDLRALGVRSIVVTSGTLSPLSSFANELRLPFEVQVENPHVIGPEQAWIGTLGRGVTNVPLNSSYANRDNDLYKDELGATLANLCRIVPGGMLVFFSTYRTMNDCVQRWKHHENGKTWSRIAAHKDPMVEPRTAGDLKAVMEEYDTKIENTGGAVFLAVCRGKVSEGMDFSDSRARCVVVTGIPYAPAMDAKVILKKKYMSESVLPPGVSRVTGQEWYQQQASRAVNQAIGRVIRHRLDFGCVVLCDARFAEERNRNSLSLWARPFVRECSGFGKVAADLTKFFKACAANPGLKHIEKTASRPPPPPTTRGRSSTSYGGTRQSPMGGGARAAIGRSTQAPGMRDSTEEVSLSSLQDVADIVSSVGPSNDFNGASAKPSGFPQRIGGVSGGGPVAGSGGNGNGTAPLGLLDALKASAKVVGVGLGVKKEGGPALMETSAGGANVSLSERLSTGGASSGGSGPDNPANGWESIPLSQRLATACGGANGTAATRVSKVEQSNRSSGLVGRSVVGGLGAGSVGTGAANRRDIKIGRVGRGRNESAAGDGVGVHGARESRPVARRDAGVDTPSPKSVLSARATAAPVMRSSQEVRERRSPNEGGTEGGHGDGKSSGVSKPGSTRRKELASFLSDLKGNVAPGAFDIFRSRAKAMKEEGVLDNVKTALPAFKGILEVLLLAPPELSLPQRFVPHLPEEHGAMYSTLVAKSTGQTTAQRDRHHRNQPSSAPTKDTGRGSERGGTSSNPSSMGAQRSEMKSGGGKGVDDGLRHRSAAAGTRSTPARDRHERRRLEQSGRENGTVRKAGSPYGDDSSGKGAGVRVWSNHGGSSSGNSNEGTNRSRNATGAEGGGRAVVGGNTSRARGDKDEHRRDVTSRKTKAAGGETKGVRLRKPSARTPAEAKIAGVEEGSKIDDGSDLGGSTSKRARLMAAGIVVSGGKSADVTGPSKRGKDVVAELLATTSSSRRKPASVGRELSHTRRNSGNTKPH